MQPSHYPVGLIDSQADRDIRMNLPVRNLKSTPDSRQRGCCKQQRKGPGEIKQRTYFPAVYRTIIYIHLPIVSRFVNNAKH
jgi:hypothetical protein